MCLSMNPFCGLLTRPFVWGTFIYHCYLVCVRGISLYQVKLMLMIILSFVPTLIIIRFTNYLGLELAAFFKNFARVICLVDPFLLK